MRRPINTVNGTYKDPNLAFSAQDALNVIPMMTEKSGTRTVSQYRQAPGLKPFCRIGTNDGETATYAGAGRGLRVVDGKLYAVAGRNLWQITSAGVSVNYGTIPGVGRVSMAHNQRGLGNELAIDNGQSRYVFNTQTQDLQKVTDESFPGSIKAVFIDGYIVFVEPQGRYWGHSDLSNALNYNIFDQYEAEGQPDRIVSAHESNRELLIFGQDTTEAYVNNPSGSGEAPFVRATNTVIKSGCAARDSVCDVGPYTVYLDQNRTVQVLNGYTPVPISTSVIDSALQACTKQQIANAYAFAVESEGFQIYYLTVPGKFTFGYDFKNREWHRRSSTGLDWWAVTDVVQWNGSWYALDSRRGDILELRWYDYPFDVQEELVREWVTGTISADQNPIFVNELEVLFGCGGHEYTTVDFPEQPEGPTISGDAPAGLAGVSWPGVTYTVSGGTPPYRLTSRPGTTLPPGIGAMSSLGVVPGGTPTTPGEYVSIPRVTDANGLWAELEDDIPIGLPVYGASGEDVYVGPTNSAWDAADKFNPAGLASVGYVAKVGSRIYVFTITAGAYSDDFGATFTPLTGLGTATTQQVSHIATESELLVFCSGGQCFASSNGEDFVERSLPSVGNTLGSAVRGSIVVVGRNFGAGHNIMVSTDYGETFVDGNIAFLADVRLVIDIGDRFAAFQSDSNGRCGTSINATSWTQHSSYPTQATVGAAYDPVNDRVCVIGADGNAYYSDDKCVTWSAGVMVATNGFNSASMLIYKDGSFIFGADGGEIWTSPDAVIWTKRLDLGPPAVFQAVAA